MSAKKFHINPHTGIPSVCRATKGNCPYGSEGEHFNTFSEAQAASDTIMSEAYGFLPIANDEVEELIDERLTLKKEKLEKFMKLSIPERAEEAFYTEDQEILNGIIKGEFDERSWSVTGPAFQNKNLDRDFLEDVLIKYPEEYSKEARMWAASNTGLSSKDLGYMYLSTDYEEIKAVALTNKNLDRRFISGLVKRLTLDEMASYPNSVIFMDPKNNDIPVVRKYKRQVLESNEYKRDYDLTDKTLNRYMSYDEKEKKGIKRWF